MSNNVRAYVTLAMICHSSFRCDERRSSKTDWIVAHTRRATMRQPHYKTARWTVAASCAPPDRGTLPNYGISEECEVVHYSKFARSASGVGQKRTSQHVRTMTALPPIADIRFGSDYIRHSSSGSFANDALRFVFGEQLGGW